MQQLCENYPREPFLSCLNLLGSHDRIRLLTILGDSPHRSTLSDDERYSYRLPEGKKSLAVSRLWAATLLQMTLPGVPCVYYGDEAGLEGYADPYCRAPYPWDDVDVNCRTIYRNAIAIRKAASPLANGNFEPFAVGDDVLGFWRVGGNAGDDTVCCILVNRSLSNSHVVRVPVCGEAADDVVSGRRVKVIPAAQRDHRQRAAVPNAVPTTLPTTPRSSSGRWAPPSSTSTTRCACRPPWTMRWAWSRTSRACPTRWRTSLRP